MFIQEENIVFDFGGWFFAWVMRIGENTLDKLEHTIY